MFSLEKETIPYWSKFLQGYYDSSGISSDSFDQAVARVTEALNADEQEFGYARLVEEIGRCRDLPLRAGLDLIADRVLEALA